MEISQINIYKKALKELNELINSLSEQEKSNIPKEYIDNIQRNMDLDYKFKYDYSKTLSQQQFLDETKALIVDLYIKYISKENEKEKWDKYYKICFNLQEERKRKQYNPNNIFKNNKINERVKENTQLVPVKKEIFIQKIIAIIKKYINNLRGL